MATLHNHVCLDCDAILACSDGECEPPRGLPACPRCSARNWRREDGAL